MTASVRIVLHPNSLSLHVLRRLGLLESSVGGSAVQISWLKVGGGARTPDYLGADLADIGGTGSTPPITGQGNGIPLVYAAVTHPRNFGGIAVRNDSPIKTIADLRGKIIAHSGGSWHQTLIATALDRAGLRWSDIVPLDLPEEVSRQQLLAGAVAAWASGELVGGNVEGARFVSRTGDILANRFVFFARRSFAERHPELLETVVAAVDQAERWIADHPSEAALYLIDALGRDSPEQWHALLTSRQWGLVPVDTKVLDEQQSAADVLHRFGLIASKIDVREATLPKPIAVRSAA
jgi:sulfonate transport system substrate-binding protein